MLENTFLDMTPQRSVRFKILYEYAMHRDSRTSKISNFKTQDGLLICNEAFRGNRRYCEVRPFGSLSSRAFGAIVLIFSLHALTAVMCATKSLNYVSRIYKYKP